LNFSGGISAETKLARAAGSGLKRLPCNNKKRARRTIEDEDDDDEYENDYAAWLLGSSSRYHSRFSPTASGKEIRSDHKKSC
jgi:hypothetical protein